MNLKTAPYLEKATWFTELAKAGAVKPYVYVRESNRIKNPGSLHQLDWFSVEPLYLDPLDLSTLTFAEHIYEVEQRAFGPTNMAMPRWVFYDCAIIPGFVAGFAIQREHFPSSLKHLLKKNDKHSENTKYADWVPLSLFIIIPTMTEGQWVAHNLCAVNSLLPPSEKFYGLGFLSKAFGLWYANVESCIGMTQWGSPALKLHTHYGHMEVITAYTPVHSHASTITYRLDVDTKLWKQFFTKEDDVDFVHQFRDAGITVDPKDPRSQEALHLRIQNKEGPFYLSANEISKNSLKDPLKLFQIKGSQI